MHWKSQYFYKEGRVGKHVGMGIETDQKTIPHSKLTHSMSVGGEPARGKAQNPSNLL